MLQNQAHPGDELTASYILMGLAAEKHPADKVTAGIVNLIAGRQLADGHWFERFSRPPMEYSDISVTALSVRSLTLYPPKGRREELERRVERARKWLIAARPQAPGAIEELSMRLLGLKWSGAHATRSRKRHASFGRCSVRTAAGRSFQPSRATPTRPARR
ncbi:MAG: hypothetical protein ACRD8O_05880 [Bryobacteraceae bacterium]